MYPLCARIAVAVAWRRHTEAAGHFLKCEGYIFKSQGPQLAGLPAGRLATPPRVNAMHLRSAP